MSRAPKQSELPIRISETEACILELLRKHRRELYGLQMVELSDGKLKRGTVYVTLQRMETKGLVESREEENTPEYIGIPRRLYKATARGTRSASAAELNRRIMAGWVPRGA